MSFKNIRYICIGLLGVVSLTFLAVNVFAADISVQEAHDSSTKGDVLLIDIRAEREWRETGVAPQATLLTMHKPGGVDTFLKELDSLLQGDKNQKIALICATGPRSVFVQQYLKQQGYTQVVSVNEGILGGWFSKGWIGHGFPVTDYDH